MLAMRIRSWILFFGARHAAPGDFVLAREHQFNGFRVDAMLFVKNFFGERGFRVVVFHWDGGLQNDGAGIEIFVHEVDGASSEFRTVLESLLLRFEAGK